MALKAYMGYSYGAGSHEGACLIFAHSSREALGLARPFLSDWFQCDFTDARARLIKDAQHLFDTEANKDKLAADIAHVIESPTTCKDCELWGEPLDQDGLCPDCAEEREQVTS